ncbi:PAS domain-containing protein [Actinoplanes sp. NPDC051513]|uniref:PAS domain-containing protein n=1 Tax=Actinoplanes sp. NPDC051513 TaxID=3363908 RepID=UPI0037BA63B7
MRQIRGLPADPVLRALALAGVLLVPWFLFGPFPAVTSWLMQACIDVLTVLLASRLYRMPGIGRHGRRFWGAITAAMGCSAIADTYQTILVAGGHPASDVSPVQSGFVVSGMAIVVATMLFHPLGGTGRQRLRMWLDAATVLTAVVVFLWYFLLAGRVADNLAAAATAAVMLLVTFGLIKLIFSDSAPFHRNAGIVGIVGVTGTAVGAPVAVLLTGHSDARVLYLAQLIPCLLVPFSLRMQEVLNRRRAGRRVAVARQGFSRLPYAAVAGTQLLLVAALAAFDPDMRIWGVAAGVLVSTGLVLARQQAAFHDNEQLVTEISASREWFSALVQQASDLTVVVNEDDTIQYASPAAERVLGAQAGDLSSETLGTRMHPATSRSWTPSTSSWPTAPRRPTCACSRTTAPIAGCTSSPPTCATTRACAASSGTAGTSPTPVACRTSCASRPPTTR